MNTDSTQHDTSTGPPTPLPRDLVARCWCRWHSADGVLVHRRERADQTGQSTVEYALVLLGAAAVALALVAWVTRSDAVQRLFDAVVSRILSQAG